MQSVNSECRIAPLKIAVRALCVLAVLTGAADLVGGASVLTLAGAALPHQASVDPILNSQIKFWGGIWFGYGIALWFISTRLETDVVMYGILLGTLFLSGLGRVLSLALYGLPGTPLTGAMLIELLAPPILWLWYRSLLRRV